MLGGGGGGFCLWVGKIVKPEGWRSGERVAVGGFVLIPEGRGTVLFLLSLARYLAPPHPPLPPPHTYTHTFGGVGIFAKNIHIHL